MAHLEKSSDFLFFLFHNKKIIKYGDILNIKEKIENWVNGKTATLIFATTTGLGVQPYLGFVREHSLRIIAITAHRLGNPRWKPFDPNVRKQIEVLGGTVVEEKALWAIFRVAPMIIAKYVVPLFGYREKNWEELLAVGGRVCLQITEIAIKENLIKEGDTAVAIAGKNAALALKITRARPPKMALLEVIFRPEIEL